MPLFDSFIPQEFNLIHQWITPTIKKEENFILHGKTITPSINGQTITFLNGSKARLARRGHPLLGAGGRVRTGDQTMTGPPIRYIL